MAEKKNGQGRTRNFASILYPESAPENWREILEQKFVPCLISPLHNKDKNANGEEKKEHYHILLMFDSVKTNEQAKEIFEEVGCVGCERINSIRGYGRYLCHLDNPDKAQYSVNDVVAMGGVVYQDIISLSTDKLAIIMEMQDFIEDFDVCSFWILYRYARLNQPSWFKALSESCSLPMKEYIMSRKWSKDNNIQLVDKNTGEIIVL